MPGGAWGGGHATGGDDGGGARRERERGVVGGGRGSERDEGDEQGRDRIGVSDGAWGEPGAGGVHEHDAGGGDGMRGDGVGVGDVGAVPGGAWGGGHTTGGDDGGGARRERERGVVSRSFRGQCDFREYSNLSRRLFALKCNQIGWS